MAKKSALTVCLMGGNGFIGSHIQDRLLECGYRVRVFDRKRELFRPPNPSVEYIKGDFAKALDVKKAVSGADVVVHLVSSTIAHDPKQDSVTDVHANIVTTINLLDNCVASGVKRLIFFSSGGAVYGEARAKLIGEDHPTDPLSSYGIVKLAIEKYILLYHRKHGLAYTIFRPSTAYGERQDFEGKQGLLVAAMARSLAGKPLILWSDGKILKDFVYAGDLAEACAQAIKLNADGVFNLGGSSLTINDALALIQKVSGRPLEVRHKFTNAVDPAWTRLDTARAHDALAWSPAMDIEEGLQRTWEWLSTAVPNKRT